MQAPENGPRLDLSSDGTDGGPRRVQHQAPMRPFGVVVLDERSEHRPEVLLVDEDQVVEALVPQDPDDPPGDPMGAGRSYRTEQGLDA